MTLINGTSSNSIKISLRAVVNTDSPESVNVFKRFRAVLSTSNVKAIVDYIVLTDSVTVFSDLRVLTEYVDLNYGVDFLNLSAVDIVLDADSKKYRQLILCSRISRR